MKLDEIQPLMIFCIAAKLGSLSKVTEYLGMHRTSIVRNIQKLETEYQKQLVSFEPNKIALTEDGRALFEQNIQYFDLFKQTLELDIQTLQVTSMPSSLRFLAPTLGASSVIRKMIQLQQHLNQSVAVSNYSLADIYVDIDILLRKTHQADIAVIPKQFYSSNIAQSFDVFAEFADPIGLITSHQYLLQNDITHENFQSHIYALTPDAVGNFSQMYEYTKHATPKIYVDTYAYLTHYLRLGYGISFCSIYALLTYPDSLVRVLEDIEVQHHFVFVVRKTLKESLLQYLDELRKMILV